MKKEGSFSSSDTFFENSQSVFAADQFDLVVCEFGAHRVDQLRKTGVIAEFERTVDPVKIGTESDGFDAGFIADVIHVVNDVRKRGVLAVLHKEIRQEVYAADAAMIGDRA